MPTRSTLLAHGTHPGGFASVDVYVVPAGIRTILKSLVLSDESGSVPGFTVSAVDVGLGFNGYLASSAGIPGSFIQVTPLWVVLNAGMKLQIVSGTHIAYLASGTELPAP